MPRRGGGTQELESDGARARDSTELSQAAQKEFFVSDPQTARFGTFSRSRGASHRFDTGASLAKSKRTPRGSRVKAKTPMPPVPISLRTSLQMSPTARWSRNVARFSS